MPFRNAWILGLWLVAAAVPTGCGDDGSSGDDDDDVDAGSGGGGVQVPPGFACRTDANCQNGRCVDGTCLETCRFSGECDTGCCAPNDELDGLSVCRELDVCFDGTQGTTCDLFAQQICAFARQDFGASPRPCMGALAWAAAESIVCETEWRDACCGSAGCGESSRGDLDALDACIADITAMPCPESIATQFSDAPCVADCYLESRCTEACASCVVEDMMLTSTAGGSTRCITTNGPILSNWAPPTSCAALFAFDEPG